MIDLQYPLQRPEGTEMKLTSKGATGGYSALWGRVAIPPRGTFGHPLSSSSPRVSEGFGAPRLPDTLHPLRQEDARRLHRASPQNHREGVHG
jgi:hypothetical protein